MRMRRALGAAVAIGLMVGALGGPVMAQDDGPAFASPDDAVAAYLSGIAAGSLDQVLDATVIDEMAERLDFDAYVERLRTWIPFTAPLPADTPLLVDLNRAQFEGQLSTQMRMLLYSILTNEELDSGPVMLEDGWLEAFRTQLDPSRLSDLQLLETSFPDPELGQSERYLEANATQAAAFGADELTERIALFSVEGRLFLLGFTLMRYGDGWGVAWPTSPLSRLPGTGAAVPVTIGPDGNLVLPEG